MSTLLAVTAGLTSGVVLRSFFVCGWSEIVFVTGLGVLFLAARFISNRAAYLLPALFLFAAALGAARLHLADAPPPDSFVAEVGSRVAYEGVVVAEPDMRDAQQRVTIEVRKGSEAIRVLAVAERYPAVAYGDRVRVSGALALPEPFDTGGRVFRYDSFLKKDGIYFLVEFASLEVAAPREGLSLYAPLYALKRAFNDALTRALPEPAASLASGLVVGGKQGLGQELKSAFTISGLIHIVVLSGYNVMIVAIAVLRLFAFLPRRVAAGLAALTIGLFVLMAGAGAASLRAGLMAGLGLYARAATRTFDALRALLVVGIAMVLWNPFTLVFDPGFQLSFIATLGLILGTSFVAKHLVFIKNEFLREIASSTIAAQIAVLPLLLYQTGLFSLVALPANLLVLPAVPLAMALSALAGLVALALPPLAVAAGLPAYLALSYITLVAETLSALPLASLTLPAFPFALVIAAYAALGYGLRLLYLRSNATLRFGSTAWE